jgi:hypothetical protein
VLAGAEVKWPGISSRLFLRFRRRARYNHF